MNQNKITLFKHFSEIDKPLYSTIDLVLDGIKNGKVKDNIDKIRECTDADELKKLKMLLPCVLFAGYFSIPVTKKRDDGTYFMSYRNDNSLSIHSKFVPFDIDDVEDVELEKQNLMKDEYIYAAWVSPSGTGIHGLIKIADGNRHEEHYSAILKRYPHFDHSARNQSRVLFFSYDENLLINENSKTFFEVFEEEKFEGIVMSNSTTDYKKLDIAAKMIRSAQTGERHNAVIKASYLVGGYIAGGMSEETIARDILRHEVFNKFEGKDVEIEYRAIDDGIKAGQYMPINELAKYQQEVMEEAGIMEEELSFLTENKDDEEFIRRYKAGLIPVGLPFGYDDMDKYLLLKEGEFYATLSHSHTGKAQPLSSKILTPDGWKLMADIKVSDILSGVDGKTQRVLGVYPQGVRDVYKVTMSDGSHVMCDKEHLWSVNRYRSRHSGKKDSNGVNRYVSDKSFETIPLSEMIGNEKLKGERRNGINNFMLPPISAIDFNHNETPICPYLLGVILGDGCITSKDTLRISSGDDSLVQDILQNEFVGNHTLRYRCGNTKGIFDVRLKAAIIKPLIGLGLFGCRSNNKFIPNIYLYNSIDVRISILKGLMDTDGTVDRYGMMSYCTVSSSLKNGVVEIVNSLGGRALVKERVKSYVYNGEKKIGQLSYNISIKLPSSIIPFKLQRKIDKLKPTREETVFKYIEKIEYSHKEECQCIKVSNDNCLYITDNYIPTHNTTVNLWLIFISALNYDWGWVIYTGENRVASVKMKLLEFYMGEKIKDSKEENMQQAIKWLNERFFFINNENMHVYKDILKYTEKVSKYHSIKGVLIDPINALKTTDKASKYDYEMEMYTDMLLFTKRTNISLFISIHSRTQSQRERDKDGNQLMPYPADADGGAVLYNKADIFITMNRNIQDPANWMVTELYVNKMRNKETGGDVTPRNTPIRIRMQRGLEFTDDYGCMPFSRSYLNSIQSIEYTNPIQEDITDCPF